MKADDAVESTETPGGYPLDVATLARIIDPKAWDAYDRNSGTFTWRKLQPSCDAAMRVLQAGYCRVESVTQV